MGQGSDGRFERDPLSLRYDTAADEMLRRAIRASRSRHAVRVWIASPRQEFRELDKGGRTAQERAFGRACYYPVFKVPRLLGQRPDYSLKIRWGTQREPSSHGRLARACLLRIYPYGSGYDHALEQPADTQYTENEALRARPGEVGG